MSPSTKRLLLTLSLASCIVATVVSLVSAGPPATTASSVQPSRARVPVLLELFTSEGCSSCPPADRLLESLDRESAGDADVVVLSEHVDYWNYLGWSDPYSSALFSERQRKYAARLGAAVYTPQLVVDGRIEVLGSDRGEVLRAIARSVQSALLPLSVRAVRRDGGAAIHVEAESGGGNGDLYIALAEDRARSQVTRGENGGHVLSHVAVARAIDRIGKWEGRGAATLDVLVASKQFPASLAGTAPGEIRIVAFLQDPQSGRILGVAHTRL